ncbi:unnamed protein product [Nippostrongylus brasiliensis]|uniref:Acyl-CoA_dh_1 domain-containing protein n=1 Tax=Nippostrongylus brasiliensis TaxID=27835 RepID=A0A0N4XE66_NIPBR|nr:unnamed protein product [Nippostrongylus brasiliensis]
MRGVIERQEAPLPERDAFWGGSGFMWDNPVCRMHRDLRLHSVGAGADEVMLSIICKYMGTTTRKQQRLRSTDSR